MSKIYCSNCGAEVILPKHSETIIGRTISENEGNNTYYINTKENKAMTKADTRMEALRAAGIDVDKYFDVLNSLLSTEDVEKNDPVAEQIITDGYVRNTKLHRRWVLAQTWAMLNRYGNKHVDRDYYNKHKAEYYRKSFNQSLKDKGYAYQWKVIAEEIRVLAKLAERDDETFNQRVHFFNKEMVIECANDYVEKLKEKIDELPVKHCKGVPYKKIAGKDIFVTDINKKVIAPIEVAIGKMKYSRGYNELYRAVIKFRALTDKYKLNSYAEMAKEFKDAYKGAGGYYSLRNLLQFHNCKLYVSNIETLKGTKAIDYIDSKLDEYKGEGYRYFAMMIKCIEDNNWVPNWK